MEELALSLWVWAVIYAAMLAAGALANIPLALVAIGGHVVGARIQRLFSAATFKRLLKYILFVMGLMLTAQGLVWFVR